MARRVRRRRRWFTTTALCTLGSALLAMSADAQTARDSAQDNIELAPARLQPIGPAIPGERLPAEALGEGFIEDMAAVMARDMARPDAIVNNKARGEQQGSWIIPSRGATFFPNSGEHYITNKWGDTRMGIGFPAPVDVAGVFVAGQAGEGVWAGAVRAVGYQDGVQVAATPWFADLSDQPHWLAIGFVDVDRVVFEATPVFNGAGWYALDDFTFTYRLGANREPIVVDFEDCAYRQVLTGSNYRQLTWERGTGDFGADEPIHAPMAPPDLPVVAPGGADGGGGVAGGGLNGTPPILLHDFQGVIRGDAGSFSFPPDTCGAIGPDHFVEVVNRNVAVYDRSTGAELANVIIDSFLPGSIGDPRVLWDVLSERFIVLVTDFSGQEKIFLAVSRTSDPMGEWFKTDFATDTGDDAGCWPDYPTLGVDESGIYTTSYMVGCGMTIFAIDKAPLIADEPFLGAVTAFRSLPFEGAIQPMHAYEPTGGEYFLSMKSQTEIRVRQLQGPIESPSLVELGALPTPVAEPPPDVPALGSFTPLDHTVGTRLLNAVYRHGSMWTVHDVLEIDRSVVRWYEFDAATLSVRQIGTISDPDLHYFYGSIAVNGNADVALGFSGANEDQYAAAYFTGRLASDGPGEVAPPQLLRAGDAAQNLIDGLGRNRFGDYSLTSADPADDTTFFTIQEYMHADDIWGTWIGEIFPLPVQLEFVFPNGLPEFINPEGQVVEVVIDELGGLVAPGTEKLLFDVGEGPTEVPLAPQGGGLYHAVFPELECLGDVDFFFQAETQTGFVVLEPPQAPVVSFNAIVAAATSVVLLDEIEGDVSGWTVTSDPSLTAGEWEQADPNGTVHGQGLAAPEDDATEDGVMAFVTANGPPGAGNTEFDVDGGPTVLTSPIVDLTDLEAVVRYAYWMFNTDAGAPKSEDFLMVEISDDAGESWVEVAVHATISENQGWQRAMFRVTDFVSPSATVQVRFSTADSPNDSVTEAGLDDFAVERLLCEPPPCPEDLDEDGVVATGDLLALLGWWGGNPGGPPDFDGDGVVATPDLLQLLGAWGPCR